MLSIHSLVYCLIGLNQVFGELKLTILHTNDVHARIVQTSRFGTTCSASDVAANKCYGGVARRKTEVDRIRGKNQNVLLLDGGNQFQGTTWFSVYRGDEAAYFMSRIGYDVMCLGKSEFNLGPSFLANFLHNASFPVVSANIDISNEPILAGMIHASVVVEREGIRIGIIGYTKRITQLVSRPGPNIVFKDELDSVKVEATKLTSQGINIIIALGNGGFLKDQDIASKVPEVDLVIGGGSESKYGGPKPSHVDHPSGPYPFLVTQSSGKVVPVVQAYAFGKFLGYLQTVFDDSGELTSYTGKPMLLNGSIDRDPAMLQEVNDWQVKVNEFGLKKVGVTYVTLSKETMMCRMHECNLGNLVTDAMVAMVLKPPSVGEWTKVAAAITNAGGFRDTIEKGEIIVNDVVAAVPYSNTLTKIELKGYDLIQMFEYSVEGYGLPLITGRFLQVSGIKVKYDVSRPKWKRVVSLDILCHECDEPFYEPVEEDQTYPILINNFIRDGGDGYNVVKEKAFNEVDYGFTLDEVLADYIGKYSPIRHSTEERIQIVNGTDEEWDKMFEIYCQHPAGSKVRLGK